MRSLLGRNSLRTYSPICQSRWTSLRRDTTRRTNSWKALRQHETIEIPLGLSGDVILDVFKPATPLIKLDQPRDVLVHLPSGPRFGLGSSSTTVNELGSLPANFAPSTTVVTINYRLGHVNTNSKEPYHFPTPVHDVSTAFDYLTSSTSPFNFDHDSPPRICLLGSHIGGALATMLALTKPNDVYAAAVLEPLVDWVSLDELVGQLQRERAPMHQMLKSRERKRELFMTPSAYFDPFASPLLFLRAPGRDTPTTLGTVAGDAFMNDLDFEDEGYGSTGSHHDHSHQNRLSPAPTTSSGAGFSEQSFQGSEDERPRSPSQPERPPRRRKVLQRWPPNGRPDDVMLPYVNIFLRSPSPSKADAGHAAIMQAQGNELCELMRRACFIGREESLAIEHVQQETFSHLDPERDTTVADRDNATSMRPRAIEWINEMFHGKDDDNDHELSRSTRSLSETQLHH